MNVKDKKLPDNIDWSSILYNLKKQKLVPFLGAGASLGSTGLPSGGELAKVLAAECGYPGSDKGDLLRIAQYYALKIGEMPLRDSVREKLCKPGIEPGEVHHLLASWPIEVVLTTNYDYLMEDAFVFKRKHPLVRIYDRKGDQEHIKTDPSIHSPLVYKLHGSLDDIDSMVITEDNYIDFLISLIEGNPKVPDTISKIFRTCSILFVGYGLKDWNIRVLLRYFRAYDDIRSFAVQRNTAVDGDADAAREWQSTVLYWEHQKISVYNCDALAFIKELDRQYREAMKNG